MSRKINPKEQHAKRLYCHRCGYTLLNDTEWAKHQNWHRRTDLVAEYDRRDGLT